MRVILPTPLDGRDPIRLTLRAVDAEEEEWWTAVPNTLSLFDRFVVTGGLLFFATPRLGHWRPGTIERQPNELTCTWTSAPFGAVGLAVALRMLDQLQRGRGGLVTVTLQGTPIAPGHPVAIWDLEGVGDELPPRVVSPPFRLELRPTGSWVTIECELSPDFPPEVPGALHEAIWTWAKVANAGGFQPAAPPGDGTFGVGINGPTEGDDFVEWHSLFMDVPIGSLGCLVNLLAHVSRTLYPLSAVYLR